MLQTLPPELLSEIITYLPTAQAVSHLALTCRTLKNFVEKEGWRIFVQSRFPSIPVPPYWYDAAHALTTLSRNWDRKAFLARYIEPSGSITVLPSGERRQRWQRPRGQTMGFQPVIDSYEERTGNCWSDRREVLTFSAGAELVLRMKESGRACDELWERSSIEERHRCFDTFHRKVDWICYKESYHAEGKDDITFINALRPAQRGHGCADGESIVLGRASGELALLQMHNGVNTDPVVRRYITNGRRVRSANVSPALSPLLAACLPDTQVALYPVHADTTYVPPISEVNVLRNAKHGYPTCRTWSTRFLSNERLAVGLGPCTEPVHVFQVTPNGLSKDPIRLFSTDDRSWGQDDRVDVFGRRLCSVYPIAVLAPSSIVGNAAGDVFLTASYDGMIRLHDMRSPSAHEISYWDSTDQSAIYSLQPLGRERIVAGAACHSLLKVFDLRITGGRAYHYLDAAVRTPDSLDLLQIGGPAKQDGLHTPPQSNDCAWNLFINPRNRVSGRSGSVRQQSWNNRRSTESPIYSLSSPSPASPSLFAGVENNIVEFNIVSMLDRHPDPVFEPGVKRKGRHIDVKGTWNPHGDVLNLAMYEQSATAALRLRVQTGAGILPGTIPGYDERWRDSSEV